MRLPFLRSFPLALLLVVLLTLGCVPEGNSDAVRADVVANPPAARGAASDAVADAAQMASRGHGSINWFDGTVEQALAQAGKDNKPVFLYWGAAWCPPCHEVQATVFRSREFLERAQLFIPVYLDGDTDNAQAVGERYGVLGYPTMIVLSADGKEITRIPGGSDIQAYANILDLTLGDIGDAATLLARVRQDPGATLAANECRLLAHYSWGQDTSLLDETGRADAFSAMSRACPDGERTARAVLDMASLSAAIEALAEGDRLSASRRDAGAESVLKMLGDPSLVRANMYTVLFDGATITGALTDTGSVERARMRGQWIAALNDIAADDGVFMTERLYARYGKLQFERIEDPQAPVSAGLEAEIRAAVDAADRSTRDPYARQSIINTARNVLVAADLRDTAKALLLKEIGISRQPYYFMVGLADIEQEAGNFTDAIGWLKRAWDDARGPATRFQWGNYYVTGLIEMAPEEVGMIESAARTLIDELGETNAFYQRPKRQLESLERRLRAWNDSEQTAGAIERIRDHARGICTRIPEREASRATCESFLADASSSGDEGRS